MMNTNPLGSTSALDAAGSNFDAAGAMLAIEPGAWPIIVQALIVLACLSLLVVRERRRSYR